MIRVIGTVICGICVVLLIGCCPKAEVMIRERVIEVKVPVMEDTVEAVVVSEGTEDEGRGTRGRDSVVDDGTRDAGRGTRGSRSDRDEIGISDSVVVGTKVEGKDTVAALRYYPGRGKFTYKIKPPAVPYRDVDTVKVYSQQSTVVREEYPWSKKAVWVLVGIAMGLFLSLVILRRQ